jgi:hypothetical protein
MNLFLTKFQKKTFMKVLYCAKYWLTSWSQLEKHEEDKKIIKGVCPKLETTTMQIFVDYRW